MQKPIISELIDHCKNKRKNVCIVLPTFNQYNETKKNIDLIKKQTLVPDIIIVDNNSNDWTFDNFLQEYEDIILIKSAWNYWWAWWFYLWQKYAYENWYERIILNDNDAHPIDDKLIENIIKHKKNWHYSSFINSAEENISSLKILHFWVYTRNEIENKWFIDYKLFIYWDDVEYYNRFNNPNLIEIDSKYYHPMKNFYPSKMIYFLIRNSNYNNIKYHWLQKIIFDNTIFLFSSLIYKYLWWLNNYFYFFKIWLLDILKYNFSKNEEIISSNLNDWIKFQKLKINNFLNKYKNNNNTLFSIKKIFNWKEINKEFSIKNIEIPRKEIFWKQIFITNWFNSEHRIILSFYFDKVIFIKDIFWDTYEIEFFEFENKKFKKILVLLVFLIYFFPILILSIILYIKNKLKKL